MAARRAGAMAALRARIAVRWPRANELCSALCGAHREAMPVEVRLLTLTPTLTLTLTQTLTLTLTLTLT